MQELKEVLEKRIYQLKQIISKEPPPRIDTDYSEYCFKVWNDTIMHDEFYEFYCKKLYELRVEIDALKLKPEITQAEIDALTATEEA